eukprot:SAG11_NODE_24507_length_372_cov_0.956044_1_plen_85_part_01
MSSRSRYVILEVLESSSDHLELCRKLARNRQSVIACKIWTAAAAAPTDAYMCSYQFNACRIVTDCRDTRPTRVSQGQGGGPGVHA